MTPSSTRIASRLLIAQACLYAILVVFGVSYALLEFFSSAGLWLSLTRLVLAASFVALALVENALRCEGVVSIPPKWPIHF